MERPQKITFGELRNSGIHSLQYPFLENLRSWREIPKFWREIPKHGAGRKCKAIVRFAEMPQQVDSMWGQCVRGLN
jgi:hypothetical protein